MKKIIIGNWKMNPSTLAEAKKIFSGIKKGASKMKKVKVVICPPFVFLPEFIKSSSKSSVSLGAQNMFWKDQGSFTGEISPTMLRSMKSEYVILGHSERRDLGETSEDVNVKIKSAIKEKLKAIVCIGDKERDSNGDYLEFLKNQIKVTFSKIQKKALKDIIVAYEPVWAIGKGEKEAMTGEELYQMNIFIKKVFSDMYGRKEAEKITILYGGSSGPSNAEDLLKNGKVNGFLVGGNSLRPDKFVEMLKIAESL